MGFEPASFPAPEIFYDLSRTVGVSEEAKNTLVKLGELSEKLVAHLSQHSFDNHEIIGEICTIASYWRSLVRDDNRAIGSDINRLKLFYAFENILDQTKLSITQRKTAAHREKLQEMEKESWENSLIRGAQDWIQERKNQFLEYSISFIGEKNKKDISYDDVLEGIKTWQLFVKESHGEEETNIRIAHLKQQVIQPLHEVQSNSQTPISHLDEEKKEISTFFQEAKKRHEQIGKQIIDADLDPAEIFAENRDRLFSVEREGVLNLLLAYEQQVREMIDFVKNQVDETIASIVAKMQEGNDEIKRLGTLAISEIKIKGEELIQLIYEKTVEGHALLLNKKNDFIEKKLEELSPESLLKKIGNPSFVDLIEKQLKPIIFKSVKDQIITNLQTNLSTVLESEHLLRLGDVGLKAFVNVCMALHTSGDKTDVEVLSALREAERQNPIGKPSKRLMNETTSLQEYKNYQTKKIAKRIARLVIKNSQSSVESPLMNLKEGVIQKTLLWLQSKKGEETTFRTRRLSISSLFGKQEDSSRRFEFPGFRLFHRPRSESQSSSSSSSSENALENEREGRTSPPPSPQSVTWTERIDSPRSSEKKSQSEIDLYSSKTKVKLISNIMLMNPIFKKSFLQIEKTLGTILDQVALQILEEDDAYLQRMKIEREEAQKGMGVIEWIDDNTYRLFEFGKRSIIEFLGKTINLNLLLPHIQAHSEIVLYYILDKVTQEMDTILKNPEGGESVNQKERIGSQSLRESIGNFEKETQFEEALKMTMPMLQPLMFVLDSQGDPNSFFDVTEVVNDSFLPKWRSWIDGKQQL